MSDGTPRSTLPETHFSFAGDFDEDDATAIAEANALYNAASDTEDLATRSARELREVEVEARPEAIQYDHDAQAHKKKVRKQKEKQLKQANKLRKAFHSRSWLAVAFCIATSAFLVGWQVVCGNASNGLLIAFVSGVTIQVIGILVIVARYLFAPIAPADDRTGDH